MKLFKYIIPSFIIFLLFGFFSSVNAAGPVLDWAKGVGGTGSDKGSSVIYDSLGNIYTVGTFQNTVDFDPGSGTVNLTAVGDNDYFVQKLNSSGDFVWVKQFGNTDSYNDLSSINIDSSNNLYITARFTGTADFNPGAGVTNLTSAGSGDVFVLKLDSNGDFVWVKQIGSTGQDKSSVITVNNDYLFIGGLFTGTVDFDPGAGTSNLTSIGTTNTFVLKLDSSGNFVWVKIVFAGNDGINKITFDSSGNIYNLGSFRSTKDFDPGIGTYNLTSNGEYDIYISKLDSSGNFVWAKSFGSTDYDFGNILIVDSSNNLYLGASFGATLVHSSGSTIDADPGVGVVSIISNGDSDAMIVKLNSDGEFISVANFGGNVGNDDPMALFIDSDNNLYIIGTFSATVDFDFGIGTHNLTSIGGQDMFVLKLDSNGDFVWVKQMGSASTNTWLNGDWINSAVRDSNGNFYITGNFAETVDFDPNAGTTNLVSNGSTDIFILKLSIDSTAPTFTLNTPTPTDPTSINITWSTNENSSSIVEYGTTTNYGSTTAETDTTTGTTTHNVTLSNLTACTTYYYRVKSNDLVSNLGTSSNGTFRTPGCAAVSVVVLQALSDAMRSGTIAQPYTPTPITQPTTTSNTVACTGNDLFNPNTGERCTTYTNNTNTKFLFNINLKYKDTNNDVKELQKFLNNNNFPVSTTGPGSLNNETTYFGPATLSAVIKYQKAKNITPAVGYFGPLTRASVNN